jgi:PEP-CTERM motif
MKSLCQPLAKLIGIAAFAVSASALQAAPTCNANIVNNCSFEGEGTSLSVASGWIHGGVYAPRVPGPALDGTYAIEGSGDQGDGTLMQQLDLDVHPLGYTIDFWIQYETLTDKFSWYLGGVQQALTFGMTENGWQQILGSIPNDPNASINFLVDLEFRFFDTSDSTAFPNGNDLPVFLDNVNVAKVTSVPEPGSLMLVGVALACGAMIRRRKLS